MAPLQRLNRQSRDCIRLIHQPAQRPDTAFAEFKKQQRSVVAFSNTFRAKLGFFQLKQLLHATF